MSATTDFARVAECDAVAICVPTPLNEMKEPDTSLHGVRRSLHRAAPHERHARHAGVDDVSRARPKRSSSPSSRQAGSWWGTTLFLAFSPERVDPGNPVYQTKNTPKVVGGVTHECTERRRRALRALHRHRGPGLFHARRRDDQAAREHLPLGEHRARQRAAHALRAHGHQPVGGRRRGQDQAVRLHALLSRARALVGTASPSIRSTCRGRRASTTSTPSSSSSRARSTRTCPTTWCSASWMR